MSTFNGEIFDLNHNGEGVVRRDDGKIFFVPRTWVGDSGQFSVLSEKKQFGYACLEKLNVTSSERRPSNCRYSLECGGCPWIGFNYKAQLVAKQKRVEKELARLGVDVSLISPIQASPNEYGYRNRAQLKHDEGKVGFYQAGTNQVCDVKDCVVLSAPLRKKLKKIREMTFDSRGILEICESDIEAPIVLNSKMDFEQANSEQNLYMKKWLRNQIEGLNTNKCVLELFCGDGNFTEEFVSAEFSKIYAIESNKSALKKLNKKFRRVQIIQHNLYKNFSFMVPFNEVDVLFLDPPRAGLKTVDLLIEKLPNLKNIIYVSCDLATYTRDLKKILQLGFNVENIQPVDLSPQTPHVEILSLLKKP